MTFLELAQKLRQEAQISGTGPVTVTGQTGQMKMLVDWINDAYKDIQNHHENWDFLRQDLSFDTIPNTAEYTDSGIGLTDLGEWLVDDMRCYLKASGIANQQNIFFEDWDCFRRKYQFGSVSTQTGRPFYFSEKPNNSLIFWPIPDAIYTVTGEYFQSARTLSANTDTPNIPEKYQLIIVYRALMFAGTFFNAPEMYAYGQSEYKKLLFRLEQTQLPATILAGPLA